MKTSILNTKILAASPSAVISASFDKSSKIVIGGHLFVQSETKNTDWNYYSKAWHRKYGPKRTITDRKVTIYRYNGRAKEKLQSAAVVEFDGRRGNVLIQAIKQSGLFVAHESKTPLSVRLDKFYDAKLIRTIGHVSIFERTLLENHVDFCAVLNDVTYHAESIRAAVRGVHTKIKAAAKRKNSPISLKLCKELGFCDAGIKEFCNVFHIDIHGDYSPSEIEALVAEHTALAAPFEAELRSIAKTLNYKTSI